MKDNYEELPVQVYDIDLKNVEPADKSGKTEGDSKYLHDYISESRDIDIIRKERKKDFVCLFEFESKYFINKSDFSWTIDKLYLPHILWSMFKM